MWTACVAALLSFLLILETLLLTVKIEDSEHQQVRQAKGGCSDGGRIAVRGKKAGLSAIKGVYSHVKRRQWFRVLLRGYLNF